MQPVIIGQDGSIRDRLGERGGQRRGTQHGLCNSDISWFIICWWSLGCLSVQPGAKPATVNKDYGNIMQMSDPSVHGIVLS